MENSNEKLDIWNYVKTGLFYVVAFILVLYISINIFMPEKTVKVFGFKPYVVITDSMEPYININDLIVVKNPNIDKLEEEDIITFLADIDYDGDKEVVTHYIHTITENSNGDIVIRTHRYYEDGETVTPDYWVIGEDDVLGQYMFKIAKVGAVVQFVKSPFGIAAMFVNIGVIAGIVFLIKRADDKVEVKEEEEKSE